MNSTANALLALGASPIMAHAQEEMAEICMTADALVLNIGTLSEPWLGAMAAALRAARARALPVVLDPVGAGATAYRSCAVRALLDIAAPAVLRGNAAEINAVCGEEPPHAKGVDSLDEPREAAARAVSRRLGCVVCTSGATDVITDGQRLRRVRNGHPLMKKVTALGCTASALIAAFCAVNPDALAAAAHAMAVLGICGEIAMEHAKGPGTLQVELLDALHLLQAAEIEQRLRLEAA